MELRICELCDAQAVVFCPSDNAFLCWTCDARVHQANFLVARHFRHPLNIPDAHVGGCDDGELDSLSSSNNSAEKSRSSATVTSADSSSAFSEVSRRRTNRSMDCMRMEDVLEDWNAKLGLSSGEMAARIACRTLKACFDRWKAAFPLRVCLAVSMWFGLRAAAGCLHVQGDSSAITSGKALKRLEEISGVPAKLILVAESRLGLALRGRKRRLRRRVELEEGWAEC